MMKNKNLTWTLPVLSILLFFGNCNQKNYSSSEKEPKIALSQERCLGNCESFKLNIYKKKVKYEGISNIEKKGFLSTSVKKITVDSLISIMTTNDFELLENEYLTNLRDLQTIKISYNGKTVTFHKREAPENLLVILESLVNYAHEIEKE